MENAVDALKLSFAVLVFVIALALTVSIVGQARATSDIILSLNDKTNYYDYVDKDENNAKEKDRIVGFETILPTIYRYAKEQYAVTILDTDGNPIVRYDLYTEGFMNDWNDTLKKRKELGNKTIDKNDPKYDEYMRIKNRYEEIESRINSIDTFIAGETGNNYTIWKSLIVNDEYKDGELYRCKDSAGNDISAAQWTINPNRDVILRIQADLKGSDYVSNNITYKGKNLNQYKDRKFKEIFLEIQTSGNTMTEQDDNNIEYSLETVKGNKKLEIIYILQ